MRLVPLLLLCQVALGYKFLVYLPSAGRSHVTFLGALADVLAEAGHEVVALQPLFEKSIGTNGTRFSRIIEVPQCAVARAYEEKISTASGFTSNMWKAKSIVEFAANMHEFGEALGAQCVATMEYPHLLEQLRAEQFDVAFGETFDVCGFGIFNVIGIEKTVLTTSLGSLDGYFDITGVPSFPSYVPGPMSPFSDQMSFFERLLNAIQIRIMLILGDFLMHPISDYLEKNHPDMPRGHAMYYNTSLIFTNTEPLIDFPKPTSHRIIEIGGITTWSAILNLRPQTVLLSFGSVAKSFLMPEDYKASIRDTFKKFPDVTFIWKYEKPEHNISQGIDNLIESTWVPQNDMLQDRRLSLFITHCGAGSTMEAMTAGVPLIVIPVMGDQVRNAQMVKRSGAGVVLEKADLSTSAKLEETLRGMLSNDTYAEKAKRIADIIKNRPFTMKEIFVNNMEFVARFGPLRTLDHFGRHMSFVQYYLIDVFAVALFLVLLVLLSTVLAVQFTFKHLILIVKSKTKTQ